MGSAFGTAIQNRMANPPPVPPCLTQRLGGGGASGTSFPMLPCPVSRMQSLKCKVTQSNVCCTATVQNSGGLGTENIRIQHRSFIVPQNPDQLHCSVRKISADSWNTTALLRWPAHRRSASQAAPGGTLLVPETLEGVPETPEGVPGTPEGVLLSFYTVVGVAVNTFQHPSGGKIGPCAAEGQGSVCNKGLDWM